MDRRDHQASRGLRLLGAGILVIAAGCGGGQAGRGSRVAAAEPPVGPPTVIDAFGSVAAWRAVTSDGVSLELAVDSGQRGTAMRMNVDFHGGGGYAIAQKPVAIPLPENYEFSFWIRGDIGPNDLEFKLIDPSGDNVWWRNQRRFEFPREWRKVTIKKRHIDFAWGPSGGQGELGVISAIEIVVTAATGGRGSVWVDELTLTPLPPERPYDLVPAVSASSSRRFSGPDRVLDDDPSSAWRSSAAGAQTITLDFLRRRELGGLVIDWRRGEHARDYAIQISDDSRQWETIHSVRGSLGGRDHLWLPETDARYLRVAMSRAAGERYGIGTLDVMPLDWAPTRNDFLMRVAADAPRGNFPRYLSGEQSYWTIVGVDGGEHEGLLNEDGMLEIGRGMLSIEPFLRAGDSLITWADVTPRQSLAEGSLPIPSVQWDGAPLGLRVTAFATGEPGAETMHARYRVTNPGTAPATGALYLAVRPLQVNPPWQFLNLAGGAATVRILEHDGSIVHVNAGERRIIPITTPNDFGAMSLEQGAITEYLRQGQLPAASAVIDSSGAAAGALAYALSLAPGESRDVWIEIPFDRGAAGQARQSDAAARAHGEARLAVAVGAWQEKLGRVTVDLPSPADRVENTIRSTLAYILINRDGPAIQPGSRSYERSWIRDGSLTSAALLRLGHHEAVREFIEWFAPHQYPSGKVPCCVDARGADPVPEHDSHGQLIYLIAEYYRYTDDRQFVARMWSHVERAVAYIDSLRRQRMTDEYRFEKPAFFGMVPESISHEGYSAKPMHSYWDAFFVLKGLKDAAFLASELELETDRSRIARLRDEFRRNLLESFRLSMEQHGIDYLPGSVELGDFDATSTTVGIAPAGELTRLPEDAVKRTFERYLAETTARADGAREWDAYTPYELRTVGTFVRLGRKQDAHRLLAWFLRDQRPQGWNHWAEVVWRDVREPKFIGDMPHTWVGSDFIRSVMDMFVYEREPDNALVVGAGIPEAWARTDSGIVLRNVATHHGTLSYTVRATANEATFELSGDLEVPYGGIVVKSPLDSPVREVLVDGRPAGSNTAGEYVVYSVPATVVIRH